MQHGASVVLGVAGVLLSEDPLTYHPACFADIDLRRYAARLDKLVTAPTPRPRLLAEFFRNGWIVLGKVDEADIPTQMFVKDPLTGGSVPFWPHQLFAGKRETDKTAGDVIDVVFLVRQDGNLCLHEVVSLAIAPEGAPDFPGTDQFKQREEFLSAIAVWRGDRDANRGILRHDETEVVGLQFAAAVDRCGGITIFVARLDADP